MDFRKKPQLGSRLNRRELSLYRILQLLSTYQNNAWCQPSMQLCIGGIVVCETVSLYILVTSYHRIPLSVLFVFIICALDCGIVIQVIFNILSYPYTKSCDFIDSMKSVDGTKWVKYFMRSCQPSKLSMGDGGFFDRLTSFVLWQLSINNLITLVLM